MKRVWLLLPLLTVFVVSGCVEQYKQPTTSTSIEQVQPTEELKTFIVEGSEFKFNPASITIDKGNAIRIIFKNVGDTIHNLVISELGVSTKTIQPRKTDIIEFTADKSGTFSFYCSIPGHRATGMKGRLTIS